MHSGESLYIFNLWDAGFALIILLVLVLLALTNKLPGVNSFRDWVNVWNSRGGNILLLSVFTFYFFRGSMRMFYHLIALVADGKLDSKEGITQLFIAFATNTAFSFCFGALVKTMTGSEGGTPVPASQPDQTISATSTISSKTAQAVTQQVTFVERRATPGKPPNGMIERRKPIPPIPPAKV